ncbi:beta strand repeat-containing protein [Hansschlegelia plantiphila]|nr:calcium-binding protein [Hansschlegelia plantiphila]
MATHIGGAGADNYNATTLGEQDVSNNYSGGAGNDTLTGGNLADTLNGGDDNDFLTGNDGADYISDYGGSNYISAGTGDDTVFEGGTSSTVYGGAGDDSIYASGGPAYVGGEAGDDYISVTGGGSVSAGVGDDLVSVYDGTYSVVLDSGDDYLSFSSGWFTIRGGQGDDVIQGSFDQEVGGQASAVSETPHTATIYGDAGDDLLYASEGADTFDGGAGEDEVSYTYMTAAVQVNLALNVLTGAAAGDSMSRVEDVTGSDFADALTGDGRINYLDGGDGVDTINGGVGGDVLLGGGDGDLLDYAGSSAGVSVNLLTGAVAGGDAEGDSFSGFANLAGSSFNDALTGDGASNLLYGRGGNDTLDGGGGADTMYGAAGDDVFYVATAGDLAAESNGEGTDIVYSSISYSLAGQYVEKLTLTGSANIAGTGNSLANTLTGNAGNNDLNGSSGADTMAGGGGNDSYTVDNAGDKVVEADGAGVDTVDSSVTFSLASQFIEKLNLTGSAAINGSGNSLDNTIVGNSGANALDGSTGADTMTGGSGADFFVFATALGSTNIDHVTDFAAGTDKVRLDDAVFAALSPGALPASAFKDITSTTADSSDRILYNHTTGALFYDVDGSGATAAKQFAVIDNHPTLTATDFAVV